MTASKSRPIALERNPNGCSTDCPAMLWTALTFPTLDDKKCPKCNLHCLYPLVKDVEKLRKNGLEQSKKIIQMTMISKYLPRFLWWKVYKYHYILETHTCQPSTSKSPVLQVARCWCHWSSVVRRSCFVPWVWTRWSSESIFGMANWPVKQVKKIRSSQQKRTGISIENDMQILHEVANNNNNNNIPIPTSPSATQWYANQITRYRHANFQPWTPLDTHCIQTRQVPVMR